MKIFGFEIKKLKKQKEKLVNTKDIEELRVMRKSQTSLPPGRTSIPDTVSDYDFISYSNKFKIIKPTKVLEFIPVIRSLYKYNEDMGSVLHDIVTLTNTGHHINFDQSVNPEVADKMRAHLKEVSKKWVNGSASIDGIVNKLITQIYVSGCISAEWIINNEVTAIDKVAIVNPEHIVFSYEKNTYQPWQKTNRMSGINLPEYIKLNPLTYYYLSIMGDEDNPYTIPPFLTALSSLATQKDMKGNINHILKQLGLLGYLEVKVDKPDREDDESNSKYIQRLNSLLTETKKNVSDGFLEGIVVGYQGDHEFEFHSTTKNLSGVKEIFDLNESQVANGLKTSGSFIGLSGNKGEGQLGIVFTKMLSQLKNIHTTLSFFLAKGYSMELALAGYDPKGLVVEFRKSTITDDLKNQQAREIKQRVLHNLWIDRIISSEIYADEMEYQKPYKVIEPPEPGAESGSEAKKKEDREKDKDKSDRRSRDKNKPQPKRKDTDTKER